MLSALASVALGSGLLRVQDPAPTITIPTALYASQQAVAEPTRLAISPIIDGKLETEEWDPFGLDLEAKQESFFQWEPGKLHFAARVPVGSEVIASFDFDGNGWLIGRDNLELRVSATGVVTGRILDATDPAGPQWRVLNGFTLASVAAVSEADGVATVEVTATDPGISLFPRQPKEKFAVRIDSIPANSVELPAFLPRNCTPVQLAFARDAGLPGGLRFNPIGENRSVVPGQFIRMRLGFNGKNDLNLTRIALRSEGFARNEGIVLEKPFPRFDNKGRAIVDYEATFPPTSRIGYRVLRGNLTTSDDLPALVQMSFRIAPALDIDVVDENLRRADMDRSVKIPFRFISNSTQRQTGRVQIVVPAPLRVLNGAMRDVNLIAKQNSRQVFDLFVPANAVGTYPITFRATINGVEQTIPGYVTIRE